SIAVHETFEGKTVWQGVVEAFSLPTHPKAKKAYAWSYKNDAGEVHHVAVLGVPPINSAYDAVRAYIVAASQKKNNRAVNRNGYRTHGRLREGATRSSRRSF